MDVPTMRSTDPTRRTGISTITTAKLDLHRRDESEHSPLVSPVSTVDESAAELSQSGQPYGILQPRIHLNKEILGLPSNGKLLLDQSTSIPTHGVESGPLPSRFPSEQKLVDKLPGPTDDDFRTSNNKGSYAKELERQSGEREKEYRAAEAAFQALPEPSFWSLPSTKKSLKKQRLTLDEQRVSAKLEHESAQTASERSKKTWEEHKANLRLGRQWTDVSGSALAQS